jgi:hypothetical protein
MTNSSNTTGELSMNMFKYEPHTRSPYIGKEFWKVVAGNKIVQVCTTEEKAIEATANLNKDVWYNDRGQTRKDRWG